MIFTDHEMRTVPLKELLLKMNIRYDPSSKEGNTYELYQGEKPIGRYSACRAHNKFILGIE